MARRPLRRARSISEARRSMPSRSSLAAARSSAGPLSVAESAFVLTCGATLAILVVVPSATPAAGVSQAALSLIGRMFAASAAAEASAVPGRRARVLAGDGRRAGLEFRRDPIDEASRRSRG